MGAASDRGRSLRPDPEVHAGSEIFYAPDTHNSRAGSWILTRHDHLKDVYSNPTDFSAEAQTGIGALLGEFLRMVPTEADAPDHAAYRAILGPVFTSSRLTALEPSLAEMSGDLVRGFAANGRCEFMTDYASRFPIGVFLQLMGLPLDDMDILNTWTNDLSYSPDFALKQQSLRKIVDYLKGKIQDAEHASADTIIARVIGSSMKDRPLTDEEKLALCFNIFVGGMDTITAGLGWQFRHLAMNPGAQQKLREDRSLIPAAIEELLRAYSLVTSTRTALRDMAFHGVTIRAGDLVTLATPLANRDPAVFPEPGAVVLDRSPNRHIAFGYGIHHCLGAALARRELRIAMETWFDATPPFRLEGPADQGLPSFAGNMLALKSLRLAWT